jgi:hypothetical protein
MFRDVEMDDLTPLVQEDDKAVKVTKRRSGDSEEVVADEVDGVIGEERLPRLGGRLRRFDSVFGDGRFSDFEPKKVEFGLNPWRAPSEILSREPADKYANFGIDSWSSRATSFRFPAPIKPKRLTMPLDDSLRFDDQKCGAPTLPVSRQGDPKQPILKS